MTLARACCAQAPGHSTLRKHGQLINQCSLVRLHLSFIVSYTQPDSLRQRAGWPAILLSRVGADQGHGSSSS